MCINFKAIELFISLLILINIPSEAEIFLSNTSQEMAFKVLAFDSAVCFLVVKWSLWLESV